MKKVNLFAGLLSAAMVFVPVKAKAAFCVYEGVWYIDTIDYKSEMFKCAQLGDENSMCLGAIYEKQRNAKLCQMDREEEKTGYFNPVKSGREVLAEMISDEMKKEHEVAGEVYERLAKAGYSDVVIAGVLGNMMNECGGNTLSLQPYIYEYEYGKHYGLCQWSTVYYPEVNGAGVTAQIDLFLSTIREVSESFGGDFEKFIESDIPSVASDYVSTYYERGGNKYQRGVNAEKAYEWIQKFYN